MKKPKPKSRKVGSATGSQFRMEKRERKGKPKPKALPSWSEVKDQLK